MQRFNKRFVPVTGGFIPGPADIRRARDESPCEENRVVKIIESDLYYRYYDG